MKNIFSLYRSWFERTIKYTPIIAAAVLIAGCVNINRLREAQDAFNQAAAAENALKFDTSAHDAVASLGGVRSGYASALLSLEQLNGANQRKLQADGLWGTALTLKALTQWRLGMFDQALATAQQARESASDPMYPRDRAVLAALPGLIKTDQAYNKILSKASLADVKALLIGDTGAVANLNSARQQVEKEHPVQLYLIQAQLAAYRNYQVALHRLSSPPATVEADDPALLNANAQLKELDHLLTAQNAGEAGEKLVEFWVQLSALDRP